MTKKLVDKPVLRGTPDRKILVDDDTPAGTPIDAGTRAPLPARTVPAGISCAICLNQRGERIQAETIVKGYAVCARHINLVAQPTFDIFKLGPDKRTV